MAFECTCDECGRRFMSNFGYSFSFCSEGCHARNEARKNARRCSWCGETFQAGEGYKDSEGNLFCSKKCYYEAHPKQSSDGNALQRWEYENLKFQMKKEAELRQKGTMSYADLLRWLETLSTDYDDFAVRFVGNDGRAVLWCGSLCRGDYIGINGFFQPLTQQQVDEEIEWNDVVRTIAEFREALRSNELGEDRSEAQVIDKSRSDWEDNYNWYHIYSISAKGARVREDARCVDIPMCDGPDNFSTEEIVETYDVCLKGFDSSVDEKDWSSIVSSAGVSGGSLKAFSDKCTSEDEEWEWLIGNYKTREEAECVRRLVSERGGKVSVEEIVPRQLRDERLRMVNAIAAAAVVVGSDQSSGINQVTGESKEHGDSLSVVRENSTSQKAEEPIDPVAKLLKDCLGESMTGGCRRFSVYPVTQDLWKMIMGENPSKFEGDMRPVENVSWNDCNVFIDKLNATPPVQTSGLRFRLPLLEEYGEMLATNSQAEEGDNAWCWENSGRQTHDVGTGGARGGLFDVVGNVFEWCGDDADKYGRRICFGGCYLSGKASLKTPPKDLFDTVFKSSFIGFRLLAYNA